MDKYFYIPQVLSDELFCTDNYQTQVTNAGNHSNTFSLKHFTKVVHWTFTSPVLADQYTPHPQTN